jgi:hypothetical protein
MNISTRNRTIGKTLTTTNSDVYVVPLRYSAYVDSIVIANVSSASVTFSLDWYDSALSTYFPIGGQVVMKPHSLIQITDGFMLQYNDTFRGLASVDSSVTISVRVREEYSVVL